MNFYEIVLGLSKGSRELGKVCVQLEARSRFEAAIEAEKALEGCYGEDVYPHAQKVSTISEDEFMYLKTA